MVKQETSKLGSREAPKAKARSNEGYAAYLNIGGIRFSGKASHREDGQRAREAAAMPEPDWSSMSLDVLQQAERMAQSRLSGGERMWYDVLGRIRTAARTAMKAGKK